MTSTAVETQDSQTALFALASCTTHSSTCLRMVLKDPKFQTFLLKCAEDVPEKLGPLLKEVSPRCTTSWNKQKRTEAERLKAKKRVAESKEESRPTKRTKNTQPQSSSNTTPHFEESDSQDNEDATPSTRSGTPHSSLFVTPEPSISTREKIRDNNIIGAEPQANKSTKPSVDGNSVTTQSDGRSESYSTMTDHTDCSRASSTDSNTTPETVGSGDTDYQANASPHGLRSDQSVRHSASPLRLVQTHVVKRGSDGSLAYKRAREPASNPELHVEVHPGLDVDEICAGDRFKESKNIDHENSHGVLAVGLQIGGSASTSNGRQPSIPNLMVKSKEEKAYDLELGLTTGRPDIIDAYKRRWFPENRTAKEEDQLNEVFLTLRRLEFRSARSKFLTHLRKQPDPKGRTDGKIKLEMPSTWDIMDEFQLVKAIMKIGSHSAHAKIQKAFAQMRLFKLVESRKPTLTKVKGRGDYVAEHRILLQDIVRSNNSEEDEIDLKKFEEAHFRFHTAGKNWDDACKWVGSEAMVLVFIIAGIPSSDVASQWTIAQRTCLATICKSLPRIRLMVQALGDGALEEYCRTGNLRQELVTRLNAVPAYYDGPVEKEDEVK